MNGRTNCASGERDSGCRSESCSPRTTNSSPLDLSHDVDLDLLRAHLDASPFGIATLHEAPPADADGWIGGRAHSIVVPLARRS
ncbi:hypothetical protein SMICM304S_00373 [Streptomyces microflavus]